MTFASVYQMFTPITLLRKQRFWDWFSGDDLKSYWTEIGPNTSSMIDAIDGGYRVQPTAGQNVTITFNNKRQYAFDGSVFICVGGGFLGGSRVDNLIGFTGDTEWSGATTSKAVYKDDSGVAQLRTNTANGSAQTQTGSTSGGSLLNNSFNSIKIETKPSSVEFTFNGVADNVMTTTLPIIGMQPGVECRSIASDGSDFAQIRYCEAFNT